MVTAAALTLILLFPPSDDAAPTLAWSKPTGADLFAQGKTLFEEKNYREAAKTFAEARKLAKGRVTKREVGRWRTGAEGGYRLGEIQKVADQGDFKSAYRMAENYYKSYRSTPIQEHFDKFIESIRDEIFHTLETFDVKSNRFSEKFGKTFVKDPELVKQGAMALEWKTTSHPASLKIKDVPRDMTRFRAVSFWMNFPKNGMKYWVVFKGAGKSATGTGRLTDNTFAVQKNHHKGWQRVEIPFKEFTQYGKIEWSAIKEFLIYFEQKRTITLYVDDITLIKK